MGLHAALWRTEPLRMRKFLLLTLLVVAAYLAGQPANQPIRGYVLDSQDQYPVPYARVTWDTLAQGVYTEPDGGFVLPWPADDAPQVFYVVSLGYRTQVVAVKRSTSLQRPVRILLSPISLTPVLVQSSRIVRPGVLTPSIERLRNVPVILGQGDIIKSLTIYPGIAGGREGLTGLHVRGGNDDQNLYLLDGTPIYNPGHLFGLLSVFSPNMVSSVDVYKDYIPSHLNRRLSSVVDVITRSGSSGQRLRSREIGLLGFNYTDEGPLGRDTTISYAASARLAHTAGLTLATLPAYLTSASSPLLFAGMYDLNIKVSYRPRPDHQLTGAVYLGDDLYGGVIRAGSVSETSGESSALLSYGNRSLSLKHTLARANGQRHSSQLNIGRYYNRYRLREVLRRSGAGGGSSEEESFYSNRATLTEYSLQHQWFFGSVAQTFQLGGAVDHLTLEPTEIEVKEGGQSRLPPPVSYPTTEAALWGEASTYVGRRWLLRVGLRLAALYNWEEDSQHPGLGYHSFVDYTLGGGQLSLGYRRSTQFIHSVDVASGGLPVRIWLPVSQQFPVQQDRTYSLSYTHQNRTGEAGVQFYASVYFRRFSEQVLLAERSLSVTDNQAWQENILSDGSGTSYGLELYTEHPIGGKFLASASYTLSRSFRTFQGFNRARRFPYDYDRPHDLYLSLNWQLTPRWSLVSAFALASGLPVTLPTASALTFDGSLSSVRVNYNNGRLPTYHRLDLLASHSRTTRSGKEGILKFGLYNVYGRRNPLFVSTGIRGRGQFSPGTSQVIYELRDRLSYGTLFTFFPMLSYEVRY